MKLINKIITSTLLAVCVVAALSSCEKKFYKDEMYRKEIYIVSGDNNIFGQEFLFGGDTCNVSIYAGGTTEIDKDVSVVVGLDYEAVAEYNKRNFDQALDKYALELPSENYSIASSTVTMSAKSGLPYALLPIQVTVDELIPDQTYFLPLRIESVSSYMPSFTKDYVLFRIFMKNDFATTKTFTYYSMKGFATEGKMEFGEFVATSVPRAIFSSKLVVPTGKRVIRMLPGAKTSTNNLEIRNSGISVIVDPVQTYEKPILDADQNPTGETATMSVVHFKPYNDSNLAVQVQDVPGKPSGYDPKSKTFDLNYRYKLANETSWYEVSETMIDSRF